MEVNSNPGPPGHKGRETTTSCSYKRTEYIS
uniref:Uncharacterized protein n=1 Tax=Arundo donax TaxID=35708 RepID=A0A0A8XYH0_ARUDO